VKRKFPTLSLSELEAKLLEAAGSLEAGRGTDGEDVFARLRKRFNARSKAGEGIKAKR